MLLEKTCKVCGITKPVEDFSRKGGAARDTTCKACRVEIYNKRYRKARPHPNKTAAPLILPAVCPCGERLYQPTNGVWLCPACAPPAHTSHTSHIFGAPIATSSQCWSCKYQLRCRDRLQQGRPVLCEAFLEVEHNLWIIRRQQQYAPYAAASTTTTTT